MRRRSRMSRFQIDFGRPKWRSTSPTHDTWFGLAVYALVQPPGGDDGAAAAAAPWDGRGAYLFSQAGKFRADSDVASSLRVRVKEERREERDGRDSAESAPCRNNETAA